MATTKDWTAESGVGRAVDGPCSTAYFADGDESAWCVHTPPAWAKRATIINHGTGVLYVSKPALSGTAAGAATAHAIRLEPGSGDPVTGSALTVQLVNSHGESGRSGTTTLARTFSTFGADGAAHKMRLIFDHGYGGA